MKEKRNTECNELSRRYTAGEMTASEIKSFELHLAGCQVCKTLVSEWNGLFTALWAPAVKAAREPGPDFDRPIMAFVRTCLPARPQPFRGRAPGVGGTSTRSLWVAALHSKSLGRAAQASTRSYSWVPPLLTIVLPSGERCT
jgi:hypothetical protein